MAWRSDRTGHQSLNFDVLQPIIRWMTPGADDRHKLAPGRLGLYAERLLDGTELPMFSRHLFDLLTLPLETPTAARKLFELVGEDYALTWKVLRLANSFHYNRANRPIDNLTHAMVVLGVGTVKNLASTLLCFHASEGRSADLRQLMIRSMTAAHVAGLVAQHTRMGDREGAYLAGMLQNLGEVLVAHRTPTEHAAIQRRVDAGSSRDAACIKEMGFTFDQLARVIGRHWKLAPSVCGLWESDQAATTNLSLLARFANELARVMCLSTAAHRQAGTALLLMRHGSAFSLTEDDVVDVWENALTQMRDTFDSLGVPIGSLT